MKTITLDQALNSDACYTADQIKALFGKRKQLSVKQIAALRIPDADKVWALTHPHFLDDKKTAVRFAVFCAEQCLDIFERQFPDDKRPRLAIEAAKAVTENDTAENRAAWAARDAARAAWDAASAAAWDAQVKHLVKLLTEKK